MSFPPGGPAIEAYRKDDEVVCRFPKMVELRGLSLKLHKLQG